MKNKKTEQAKKKNLPQKFNKLLPLIIAAITFIIYFQSIRNDFQSSWDDNTYITDNSLVQSFHGDSIGFAFRKAFTTNVAGNYHPLTMISYGIEYANFRLNAKVFHTTNLLLHILNAIAVFYFIWLLTKKQSAAFIIALLFAIHPMHVESVAWISERKDVLYSFFYISALCVYVKYVRTEKNKTLLYVLLLLHFIAAILSKAMAATLPVVFFLIDYYSDRKFSRKTILEKIPFLIVAIVLGYVAIVVQKSSETMEGLINYNFFDRILFSCYGIMSYLWKAVIPANLSAFYSYPLKQGGSYPVIYYVAPLIVLGLLFLVYYFRKNRNVIFGSLFFLVTVALVIQIIPVGAAIMADRYTYLPYIGLFFIVAMQMSRAFEEKSTKNSFTKASIVGVLVIFSIAFCYGTIQRIAVWKNSFTLWNDAISKNDKEPVVYAARGGSYYLVKDFGKAIEDFSRAIVLKKDYYVAYYNRGLANHFAGRFNEAIQDFTVAAQSGPKFDKAYSDRGNSYTSLQQFETAIHDYTISIERIPNFVMGYVNRGVAYGHLDRYKESIDDFNEAIRIDPRFDEAYFNRGITFYRSGKYKEALADLEKAKDLGYTVDPSYIETVRKAINN